ncbi:MAG: AtpZ/AtpI family protein [Alphaproteobacteria bacterium]
MTEDPKRASLGDLKARLSVARNQHDKGDRGESGKGGKKNDQNGLGFALRIGTDLVAALVVGVGIGVLLDYWLETKPWFLIVFFLLGAAAGFLNIFRLVSGYGLAAGYKKTNDDDGVEAPKGSKDGT